jgi:SRSO17 transposase
MLARALDAGVPVAWVTADEVYGSDGRLRRWLEERDVAHVLAVNCNQSLVSGLFRFERADQLATQIPAGAWRHLSAGQGAKGERLYAWARVAIRPLREPGRGHWLLVRRSLDDGELAYYVCYGPAQTSLAELVRGGGGALDGGVQLPAGQGRDRAGPLRGPPLPGVVPARHLVDAGAGVPGRDARPRGRG